MNRVEGLSRTKEVEQKLRDIEGDDLMRLGLQKVFEILNFPSELIRRKGVVCVDVEFGREMSAFKTYKPNPFIVTEPRGIVDDEEENLKDAVLRQLAQSHKATLFRCIYTDTFNWIREQGLKVALITRLNVFPEWISPGYMEYFLEAARDLLIPEGLILASIQEESLQHCLEKVAQKGVTGLNIEVFPREENSFASAGQVFLVARPAP